MNSFAIPVSASCYSHSEIHLVYFVCTVVDIYSSHRRRIFDELASDQVPREGKRCSTRVKFSGANPLQLYTYCQPPLFRQGSRSLNVVCI